MPPNYHLDMLIWVGIGSTVLFRGFDCLRARYEKAITCYLPRRVDIKFSLSEQIRIELHIGEQFISILGY